jgi:hypothetical protein
LKQDKYVQEYINNEFSSLFDIENMS